MPGPDMNVSPALYFDTINAYQQTAALKTAIELDLFTAIAEGRETAQEIAESRESAERGVRILCDYLTVLGFLTKQDNRYRLTADTAVFLSRKSPAFVGGSIEFLLNPKLMEGFNNLTASVRNGGTVMPEGGTVSAENPIWIRFARAMAPLQSMSAELLPKLAGVEPNQKLKVLDIAASHGLFGIAFARQNPHAEVTALDWANVLEVAKENAERAGVADRFHLLAGSAFEVDYGRNYDLILIPNFLHHFDSQTCETFLRKVHAALADGGRAVILEFVPNEDRVSPPESAKFSLVMLASTPQGDAHTFSELERMCANAGFSRSEQRELPPSINQVVISYK
jgi:2-polyprenyl-3-methyl-5-hydroxy-6-metoxy-1,4-benzoquinol methylase